MLLCVCDVMHASCASQAKSRALQMEKQREIERLEAELKAALDATKHARGP